MALLGLILVQDWARHRLECVPIASARSNVHGTPQPVQPRLITVSAILFAPQEGKSSTCFWYSDAPLAQSFQIDLE